MFIECELHLPKIWWWRLKSRNGKILAASETFSSPSKCVGIATKIGKALGLKVKIKK